MDTIFADVKDAIIQLGALLPESVLFGSFFLYFITMNKAFGVFSIFIIEVILSHMALSWVLSETEGPGPDKKDLACNAGFKIIDAHLQRHWAYHQYPSYSFFSVMAIVAYLAMSTNESSESMAQMDIVKPGEGWGGRATIAYTFMLVLVIIFFAARMSSGCDTFSEIMIATVIGITCGSVFFMAHKIIFGRESVNFLGVPLLQSKSDKGTPIYVCTSSNG
jgi:hypothetical protein